FSSRRRHTRFSRDWSSDVCSSDLKDTCAATIQTDFEAATHRRLIRSWSALRTAGELPPWLGDPDFHRAHQSALLRKNREYYLRYFPDVPDDLPYVWPESDRPRTRLRHDRAR